MRTTEVRTPERSIRQTSSPFREKSRLEGRVSNRPGCDCEEPGYFNSGVPGIIAHVKNGIVFSKVERCDTCRRYRSDFDARLALLWRGFRAKYSTLFEIFIYCRKCGRAGGPSPEGFHVYAAGRKRAETRPRGSIVVECGACANRLALPVRTRSRRRE